MLCVAQVVGAVEAEAALAANRFTDCDHTARRLRGPRDYGVQCLLCQRAVVGGPQLNSDR